MRQVYDGSANCNKMSKNLHSQTLRHLGEAIVAGHYPRDKAVPPEPILCVQLGVSRTVLRETVKSLVAKGLLSTGPKVGTRVLAEEHWNWLDPDVLAWQFRVGFSTEFLRSVCELRRVVEPQCLGLAAERATAEQLTELQRSFDRMRQAVAAGLEDLSEDVRFHQLLLKAGGNRLLSQMSKLLRAMLREGYARLGRRPAVPDPSLPWHAAVLSALLARDPSQAQQAMEALIDAMEQDLLPVLRGQSLGPPVASPPLAH